MAEALAVYTTVYPASERFFGACLESLAGQTDQDFDLWVGVDAVPPERLEQVRDGRRPPTYVTGNAGASPASIRARAWEQMVDEYDAIVLIDSDDVAEPSRVAAARAALARCDVVACALTLMDERGADLGHVFGAPEDADLASLLAHHNVFGLSNTAYRADVLRDCLPLPADCRLIDWLLATQAWASGARLELDPSPRMRYRQYPANTTRVFGPFAAEDVLGATALVLEHYRFALATPAVTASPVRAVLLRAQARAVRFHRAITSSQDVMRAYLEQLNRIPAAPVWWWSVAHPVAENLWSH
jgi:glycosyltransferase involved in cell wall biosynthesis